MRGVPGLRRAERARALHRAELGWFVVVLVLVTVVSTTFNWAFVDRRPEDPVRSWLGGIQDGRSRQLLSYAEEVRADPARSIGGGHDTSRAGIRSGCWRCSVRS